MTSTEGSPAVSTSGADAARPADWFKDAVIYQLHVRSFSDSNNDGIGDFVGLTQKLEYVASLGATAVWILPFYPSPLRDEGYDIADYRSVNPIYGTLDDFKKFLEAAHQLGLAVITELVINHTSDQHPWFQRARRAPKGSPERDFYVWSDTVDRYPDVRVIFQDFELSNWTWDPVAQQYFWHRFYSHQPDLNFDNSAVCDAVMETMDFWFEMGIDGVRLDAIPYLYERDGTNCESLPETHTFLKALRKRVDEKFPGRFLLAEANQWPEETSAYFGDDDECHMCFNFPLMPRLFMAVQQEERFPIVDILRHTPAPPPNSQWAIFLRNHDELTLEMVTDEERDAMLRYYASDPQSRVNLGMRRRLAPLLRNDRRRLELMHALLFALPGTPVMYYGDEVRMGDNIYLRDRDSVRTPMQWSPDRNAGFSQTNPHRLFLPTIVDPEYHYQSRNVETEEQSPHSFLWWLRRVLRVRRRYKAFGRGELTFLMPQNPRILAFIRQFEDEVILVVVNLSRLSQFVELDLSAHRGRIPVELFGQTRFPMIGEMAYLLSLGPHGFYWFRLDWPHGEETRREPEDLPTVRVHHDALEAFGRPLVDSSADAIGTYLPRQSWYLSPERIIRSTEVLDVVAMPEQDEDGTSYLTVIARVHYTEGEAATYQLTLMLTGEQRAKQVLHDRPTAGVLRILSRKAGTAWYVCDSTFERSVWERYVHHLQNQSHVRTARGLIGWRLVGGELAVPREGAGPAPWRIDAAQGAVAAYDRHLFVKLNRRIEAGRDPEVELGMSPAAHVETFPSPHLRGVCEYRHPDEGVYTLGTVYNYVSHERPLLDFCRDDLRRALETALAEKRPASSDGQNHSEPPADGSVASSLTAVRRWFALLGRRLGDAHSALANMKADAAFTAEPFSLHYRQSLFFGYRAQAQQAMELLGDYLRRVPDDPAGTKLRASYERLQGFGRTFRILVESRAPLVRVRIHDNLTLDHVLLQGEDLRIVGWESDPRRSYGARRIKQSVLVDLSRILDSLHRTARIVVTAPSADQTGLSQEAADRIASTARTWYEACASSLRDAYYEATTGRQFLPENVEEFQRLLRAFRLDLGFESLLVALEEGNTDQVESSVSVCADILGQHDREMRDSSAKQAGDAIGEKNVAQ
jgi:maltose alpha-D-glucosyltransferase / alpha-amylase